MNRGRPRHDDILTPREWQVLDLLREGLTNEEIAERLGVAHNTVKYHVSEILSKLGLQTRREAAAWPGRPRAAFGLAPLFALLRRPAPRHLATGVIAAAALGLIVLAAGVIVARSREAAVATTDVTPTATSAGTTGASQAPPSAPDGRTGDPVVDGIIEDLLTLDAAGLGARYGDARVQSNSVVRGDNTVSDSQFLTTDEWTQRLASAQLRRLFAVRQQSTRHDIFLEVTTATGTLDGWTIMVQGDHVDDIWVRDSTAYGPEVTQSNARSITLGGPDIGLNYDTYVVLPPPADLPEPPPVQDGATRTGDGGVDALIAAVEARDAAGLEAAIASPDAGWVRECDGLDTVEDAAFARDWARDFLSRVVGLESVANLPEGFSPAADHVLTFIQKVDRYRWQSEGLFERDGRIVGIVNGRSCTYFPGEPVYASFLASPIAPGARTYLVAPPPDNAPLDASRNSLRTGNALLDSILDALAAGDAATLQELIQYTPVPCGPSDQVPSDRAPWCRAGQQPGDKVDAFPVSACNGGGGFTESMPGRLPELLDDAFVYAVVSNGGASVRYQQGSTIAQDYVIVLSTPDYHGRYALTVGAAGITSLRGDCGYWHPEWLIGDGAPDYLLAPPAGMVSR